MSTVDAAFVNATFHDLVSHGPSASSSSYWTGRLVSGATTRPALLSYLAGSPAAARASLISLYFRVLQRAPSDAALASWTAQITSHRATVDSVTKAFLASDEFYQHMGSTANWVNQLYGLVLGRPSTPTGAAHWVSLAETQGLTVTAAQFYDSAGARTRRVDLLYARLLHRAPSGASLAHWVEVEPRGRRRRRGAAGRERGVPHRRPDPARPPTDVTAHGGRAPGGVGVGPGHAVHLPRPRVDRRGRGPPGLTSVPGTGLVGTPTHAGTFHTYVIVTDASDVVVDTVTVTELA